MGYKRTVRCSHCYESGHNKMGCPQFKEQIERYRADYGDDYYAVSRYDEKKARMSNAKNNRSCSYCGTHGHSRSQCTKLKAAKELFRTKNVEYRENYLKALIDNGVGPGAMLKFESTYRGEIVGLIKKIHWDKIHMGAKHEDVIQFIPMKDIRHVNDERWYSSTRLSNDMTGGDYGPTWEIAVPTSSSAILDDCPKNFIGGKKVKGQLIAGKLGINNVFRDKDLTLFSMKDHYGDFDNEFDLENYTTELR
jgi:hypothetical protein